MNLTRRKTILALAILILIGFKSRSQLVRKKFSNRQENNELSIAPEILPKNEIDLEVWL